MLYRDAIITLFVTDFRDPEDNGMKDTHERIGRGSTNHCPALLLPMCHWVGNKQAVSELLIYLALVQVNSLHSKEGSISMYPKFCDKNENNNWKIKQIMSITLNE